MKKTIFQIEKDKYLEKCNKTKEKLQKTCEHDWETFRDYMGKFYSCKKCGKYEY